MSGAPEGLAGLALSAISLAALFTTCIECFDINIAGENFSEDFEQLPDIRPGVERILKNIKSLLEEGSKINKKYGETLPTPQLMS
ncbi:hypothetical protein BPAE_0227g00140 [Botrytis paeoniae]|uniref:Prion-inhibition and propagation HeLo domain-containing protein n=1 Tax=Botrytis paeoniae TaxID=278948 RepID=A0A4Z1FF17_9HELO|nr:hypothetical protein BPAE_0227g00140 [Botrytis paeoniae]